jgi:hypothetical protein
MFRGTEGRMERDEPPTFTTLLFATYWPKSGLCDLTQPQGRLHNEPDKNKAVTTQNLRKNKY